MFMMEETKYMPILIVPAVPVAGGIRFMHPDRQLDIKKPDAELLWDILSKCNGHNTVREICRQQNEDADYIKDILAALIKLEILEDANRQYMHFHRICNNPQKFQCAAETVLSSGNIEKPCHVSGEKTSIDLEQLNKMCWHAVLDIKWLNQNKEKLYPIRSIRLLCVVPKKQSDLADGIYEFDFEKCCLVLHKKYIDVEMLKHCYDDEGTTLDSSVQIIICVNLGIYGAAYSNRGYRISFIEAGCVLQNIMLYCKQEKIDIYRMDDFLDEALKYELQLNDESEPALVAVVGQKEEDDRIDYKELLAILKNKYVGCDKIIKEAALHTFSQNVSFFGAWVRFGANAEKVSGAAGCSVSSALSKAIIEAYERYRSGQERIDYIGASDGTDKFMTLDMIAPLAPEVRKDMCLEEYYPGKTMAWTIDMSGQYYLPTDYVFYGNAEKRMKLLQGNASGAAAYTDYEGAKIRALAELIERDSIMRTWYCRTSPPHVSEECLTVHARNRIAFWSKEKRKMHILRLESKQLPVYLCIIEGGRYPCFVCGAAAAFDSTEDAVNKAIQEAEYNMLLACKYPYGKAPELSDVKKPIDHGRYYHFYENSEKIKWLWSNDISVESGFTEGHNYDKIIKELKVVFVDLTDSEDDLLKVVRAVSEKLIPIGFGYGRDYCLHPEVQKLRCSGDNKQLPHFFS